MGNISTLQGDSSLPDSDPGLQRRMDELEIIDGIDDPAILEKCTPATEETLCETNYYENAWIMFDLGETVNLRAVQLAVFPHPLNPPMPPLPLSPNPSPPSPMSPPPPSPSPPPPLPPTMPPPRCDESELIRNATCYHNLIYSVNNGLCEDGYPYTDDTPAVSSICALGTDYGDCPARCPYAPPPSPPPPSPPPKPPPSPPTPPMPPSAPPLPPFPPPPPVAYRILHDWDQTCAEAGVTRRMDLAECNTFTVELGDWIRQYDHDNDGYNHDTATVITDSRYPCGCIVPIGATGGFSHEMYGLEQRGILSLKDNVVQYNNYCPVLTMPYGTTSLDFPPISDNINHNGYRRVCPMDSQVGVDASMWIVTPLVLDHIYCDHTTHVDPITLGATPVPITLGYVYGSYQTGSGAPSVFVDQSGGSVDYCIDGRYGPGSSSTDNLCTSDRLRRGDYFEGHWSPGAMITYVEINNREDGDGGALGAVTVWYLRAGETTWNLCALRNCDTQNEDHIYLDCVSDAPATKIRVFMAAAFDTFGVHEIRVYTGGTGAADPMTVFPNAEPSPSPDANSAASGRQRFRALESLLDAPPASPPVPPMPPHVGVGDDLPPNNGFELWYSDSSAFFGTKSRTVLRGTEARVTTLGIDLDERGDAANGRYVSLRIFHAHKRLRIDWMRVLGDSHPPPPPPLAPCSGVNSVCTACWIRAAEVSCAYRASHHGAGWPRRRRRRHRRLRHRLCRHASAYSIPAPMTTIAVSTLRVTRRQILRSRLFLHWQLWPSLD